MVNIMLSIAIILFNIIILCFFIGREAYRQFQYDYKVFTDYFNAGFEGSEHATCDCDKCRRRSEDEKRAKWEYDVLELRKDYMYSLHNVLFYSHVAALALIFLIFLIKQMLN